MHAGVPPGSARYVFALAFPILILGGAAAPSFADEPPDRTAVAVPVEGLPDAPTANLPDEQTSSSSKPELAFSSPAPINFPFAKQRAANGKTQPAMSRQQRDALCQSGALRGKPCKLAWVPILWQSFQATAAENLGNIAMDSDTRLELTHNPYWATYIKCVHQYRYRQWSDDTPFIVHDIGHPMQGAIVYSIYEQNDPKSRGLDFVNNGNYWRGHLKAMAVVTLYEIQWKIGPISEASIGNSGLNTYFTPRVVGRSTNETGFQDFFITPVYGLGWNIMEEMVDRHIMPHIWKRTRNKWILAVAGTMTPCRSAANILRYKPPYYRDVPYTPLRNSAATN